MALFLDDESFFSAPEPVAPGIAASAHKAVRVKLDPITDHTRGARAELHPVVQEQAQKMREALTLLEQRTQKMREALHQLEQKPRTPRRRASDRDDFYERRRAHRREPEDPNQLYLFDQELLKPKYSAPPAVIPAEIDSVSIENFTISLAYGDDGMGLVGATLVALASGDSNGDGIIDNRDVYPDNSPVQRLSIDLHALRDGMMEKVRELVQRFDINGNGRIDGATEAFAFLRHVAHLELDVDSNHVDKATGMITTDSYVRAFGECLMRGLPEVGTNEA